MQALEVRGQAAVETRRRRGLAREAMQEDEIDAEDVVERGVKRAEEGAPVAAPFLVGEARTQIIEPRVHPAVVVGHQACVAGIDHGMRSANRRRRACLSILPMGRRGMSGVISKTLGTL